MDVLIHDEVLLNKTEALQKDTCPSVYLVIREFIEPYSKCIVTLLVLFTSRFYLLFDFILLQKCQMICF